MTLPSSNEKTGRVVTLHKPMTVIDLFTPQVQSINNTSTTSMNYYNQSLLQQPLLQQSLLQQSLLQQSLLQQNKSVIQQNKSVIQQNKSLLQQSLLQQSLLQQSLLQQTLLSQQNKSSGLLNNSIMQKMNNPIACANIGNDQVINRIQSNGKRIPHSFINTSENKQPPMIQNEKAEMLSTKKNRHKGGKNKRSSIPTDKNKSKRKHSDTELAIYGIRWKKVKNNNIKKIGGRLIAFIDGYVKYMNNESTSGYAAIATYSRLFCESICNYVLGNKLQINLFGLLCQIEYGIKINQLQFTSSFPMNEMHEIRQKTNNDMLHDKRDAHDDNLFSLDTVYIKDNLFENMYRIAKWFNANINYF